MRKRRQTYRPPSPTEAREQQTVGMWLDYHRVCWFHVPNETGIAHGFGLRVNMKRAGVKPGVPDIIIIDPPPSLDSSFRGAVIEMKRINGAEPTPHQWAWLDRFKQRKWAWAVCKGADEAIARLKSWGYGL